MDKELSEMTIEELWRLFPISLVNHNDKWDTLYKEVDANRNLNRMLTEN